LNTTFTLSLAAFAFLANAQNNTDNIASQQREHVLIAGDTATTLETLSGINLKPAKKGTFQLSFDQKLKENAVLEIKNTAGKLVYQKPVSLAKNTTLWTYNVGKLQPDTYLIEVKTSDTTYWTKFKVGR
jgi:hypothetical protein